MSFINTTFGIILSLVLGLSSAVSFTHNHYFHDRLTFVYEYDHQHYNHLGSLHKHHNSNDEHDESGCVFSVVQHTESLIVHLVPHPPLKTSNAKETSFFIGKKITQSDNGFFARAPPLLV